MLKATLSQSRNRRRRRALARCEQDKAAARAFVAAQAPDVRPRLKAVIEELASLGESPQPPRAHVGALLDEQDAVVDAGVDPDVSRLAVVDLATPYLKQCVQLLYD